MAIVLQHIRPLLGPRMSSLHIEGTRFSPSRHMPSSSHTVEIDAEGKIAFPGFVNAHTHLAMVLFRGLAEDLPLRAWLEDCIWPIERRLRPADVYWCTLLACAEVIRGGTTCVIDMYFHIDQVARALEECGLRGLVSYGMVAEDLDRKGRAELATTEALIRTWNGVADGRIRVAVAPHALYTVGEDVWRAAIDLAEKQDVPIHTHIAESRREVNEWQAEKKETPVASLERMGALNRPMLAAHCVHVTPEDILRLAAHEVVVGHCPKSNAKLGSGIAPIPALLEAGAPVGLGTDGAGSNNRLDMFEEMRAAWTVQCALREDPTALTGRAVLDMASSASRSTLGFPTGRFSAGEPADIVLIDERLTEVWPPHDPVARLVYAAPAASVSDVIVDGRILMRNRELLTIDEDRVQWEVERLLRRCVNE